MSTSSPSTPETDPTRTAELSTIERRSSLRVPVAQKQVFATLINCVGLQAIDYGVVASPNQHDSSEGASAERTRLGWRPLAHREPEAVVAGVQRAAGALSALMQGGAASMEEVYAQANDFNELLFAERLENADPVTRVAMIVANEMQTEPFPGLCIQAQPVADGQVALRMDFVPDLWNVPQATAN